LTVDHWPGWIGKIRVDLFKVVPDGSDQRIRTLASDPFKWKVAEHSLYGRIIPTKSYCGEGVDEVGTRYYARVKVKRKRDPIPLVLRTPLLRTQKPWDCPPFEQA
jgi:hypothetical protein